MTIAILIGDRENSILTCSADAHVREAVALLAERRIGAVPVMDGETVIGMFSERDVIYRLHEFGPETLDRKVCDLMTAPAVTVDPETTVNQALSLMTRRRVRHLPVMSGGRMIGLVSIGDLVKYRIDQIASEAEAMRSYIQTA